MIGAIAGDMAGAPYEFNNISNEDFGPLFGKKSIYTDDSVLTIATADAILNEGNYGEEYYKYASSYPNRGYGGNFAEMLKSGRLEPYDSYGNGSAMRVGPIGWAFETEEEVLEEAKASAEVTHNHPEGIKGAQAIALAGFHAKNGWDKTSIMSSVTDLGYDLTKPLSEFVVDKFDVSCQGTIPLCMAVFNETDSFEDAIRTAVMMGGDADTNAAIVGGIAEAHYGGIPMDFQKGIFERLPEEMANITVAFIKEFIDKDYIKPDVIISDTLARDVALSSLFS